MPYRRIFYFILKPLRTFDTAIAMVAGFGILIYCFSDCVKREWDFAVYYLASIAIWQGDSPYSSQTLSGIAETIDDVGYGGLPYLYPPHLARILWPVSLLDYYTASFVWIVFKCLALECIIVLTIRLMKIPLCLQTFILIHITAIYFRPVGLDFNSGNVATFETLLILSGLAGWACSKYVQTGFSLFLGGSLKGSLLLLFLYPLHLRDTMLLKSLIAPVLCFLLYTIMDASAFLHWIEFFRGHTWAQMWDEQIQSFYNCSSTTVILRTFCETYFAEPIFHFPPIAYLLIPLFPVSVFALMGYVIQRYQQCTGFDKTDPAILSVLLFGLLLLPPRLAGYSLVMMFFPTIQTLYAGFVSRNWFALVCSSTGFCLLQMNLPPNHIPAGFSQLLIDKDFFALLLFFIASAYILLYKARGAAHPPDSQTDRLPPIAGEGITQNMSV